jgi:pimeloyl-ACP methyl ester carboxylesterase
MKELFFEPFGISYRLSDMQVERQTLVFIHGLSASSSAWFPYEKIFEGKFNILNLDLLGHGKSKKPKEYEAYSVQAHAHAICELLSHVGVAQFVIVSHSLGTLVALEILLAHTEKALGSIFLSPSYQLGMARVARITHWLVDAAAAAIKPLPLPGMVRGRTDYTKYQNTGDWNVYRTCSDIWNTTLRSYLYSLSQIYRYNEFEKWKRITIPTLIVHGKLDSLIPVEHAVRMHQVVAGSKLILLDDSDHLIILNNVAEISLAIENFMDVLNDLK